MIEIQHRLHQSVVHEAQEQAKYVMCHFQSSSGQIIHKTLPRDVKARCVPSSQCSGWLFVPLLTANEIVQHYKDFLRLYELFRCSHVPKLLLLSLSLSLWFWWAWLLLLCPLLSSRGDISTFLHSVRGPPSKRVRGAGGLTGSSVHM